MTSSGSSEKKEEAHEAPAQQPTTFSFTVSTSQSGAGAGEKEEDKLAYDWSFLREWAATQPVTSQARMLFEAEKKDRMSVEEATSKFVVIRRLLDDELKRRGI